MLLRKPSMREISDFATSDFCNLPPTCRGCRSDLTDFKGSMAQELTTLNEIYAKVRIQQMDISF